MLPAESAVPGYVRSRFEAKLSDGSVMAHDVFRHERTGPSVVVIHEAFGLTPSTLGIAERVRARGMTPILPLLAGEPLPGRLMGYRNFARICIRREFGALARNEATPIVDWLSALADDEYAASGGRPVGVIGMCFSGGYALAMALKPSVRAAVSSQPAFPAAIPGRRRNLGVNPDDLDDLRTQTGDGKCVRTLRYRLDLLSPGVRCDELVTQLPQTDAVEIPTWNPFDHSVLSDGLEAAAGSKLASELAKTIDFLHERLVRGETASSPGTALDLAGS
jgi:hypothetical protein